MIGAFHFVPGKYLTHRLDPRFKLAWFLAFQCLCIGTDWPFLMVAMAMIGILGWITRMPWYRILAPVPALLWLYGAIIVMRLFPWAPGTAAWYEQILLGIRYCLNLHVMIAFASIMLACTRIHDLQTGLLRLLRPFPVRFAWSVSLMLSLVFLFVPLLLDHLELRRMAIKNRGGHLGGFSLKRLIRLVRIEIFGLLEHAMIMTGDIEAALRIRQLDFVPAQLDQLSSPIRHQVKAYDYPIALCLIAAFAGIRMLY
jgi:energy-coupling factor transporter transmembrane protein EcfT